MAKDAPDPRAQALADKLAGKAVPDNAVIDMLAGAVTVGTRDEEGKPIGDQISAEEYRKRQSVHDTDDTSDDDELDTDEEGGDEEEDGDEIETEEEDDEADDQDDEDEETDDEEDGDEYEEVAYSDEDVIPVQVDGSTEEVSLRELKRVYSLQGATEKRLKEATELRKAAQAEREVVAQEISTHRTNMLRTIQQLDGVLFAELVPKPEAKLRLKNLNEYILQQDAYEEDQKRIKASREQLTTFIAQEHKALNDNRQAFRLHQQKLLAEKMPELLDPAQSPKIQQDIMMAASHYGFGPELVAEVDHHGMFLMARDAARWLNMQKFKRDRNPTVRETTTLKRKRHLKAGGTTATKVKLVRAQKEQRAAEVKARTTGRVDDVSAMLVAKARRRQPNGRTGKNL